VSSRPHYQAEFLYIERGLLCLSLNKGLTNSKYSCYFCSSLCLQNSLWMIGCGFWNDCNKIQTMDVFFFHWSSSLLIIFLVTKNYSLLWFSGLWIFVDQQYVLAIQSCIYIWDWDLHGGMKWILCTDTVRKKIKTAYKIFWQHKLPFFMDGMGRLSSSRDGEDDI